MRIEEDALYSSRGHFAAGKRWSQAHFWVGLPAAIGAAVAGAAAINQNTTAASVTALTVAALTAVLTFLNPSDKASTHHAAGTRYNTLRNRARRFREIDLLREGDSASIDAALKALATDLAALNEGSPQIPRWAFRDARRSIHEGETTHAIDSAPGRKPVEPPE